MTYNEINYELDFQKLRTDLEEYFKTIESNPFGVSDVLNLDNATNANLVVIALQNGFDLKDYEVDYTR